MALRHSSAPLIHANPGGPAPLIHASVGPAAPLVHAPTGGGGGVHAPSVGGFGGGRGKAAANGAGGPNVPVAKFGTKFHRPSGENRVVATIGSQVFDWSQVKSALDRGQRGQRLSANDQAIYDAWNQRNATMKSEAEAKAAHDLKIQDEIDTEKRKADEWTRQHDILRGDKLKDEEAAAERKGAELADERAYKEAQAQAERDRLEAEADKRNERLGIDKGVRLSQKDYEDIEAGRSMWDIDPQERKDIDVARKEINGNQGLSTYEKSRMLAELDEREKNAMRGVFRIPGSLDAPQTQVIGGKTYFNNGGRWEAVQNAPKTPEEIAKEKEEARADKREDQRLNFIQSRVNAARAEHEKAVRDYQNSIDPRTGTADGTFADPGVFDPTEAIRNAGTDWNKMNAVPAAPEPEEEEKPEGSLYGKSYT